MFQEERKQEILKILEQYRYATVEYLAETIHISPSSIRRDLAAMEKAGAVKRSYGGVELVQSENKVTPFFLRAHENQAEKKIIAKKAAGLVPDGSVLFIDTSTSAFCMMEYLTAKKDLTIFTNNVDVLNFAAQHGIRVYCTGGFISPESKSALIGSYAQDMLHKIHVDYFFFSTQSLSCEGILTDCYEEENCLRQIMLKNSSVKVFLCDSTKLNKTSVFRLCSINDVDYAISNASLENFLTSPHTTSRLLTAYE